MSYDRIVCSSTYGGLDPALDLSKVFYGEVLANVKTPEELYGVGGKYSEFQDVLIAARDKVELHNTPVYIYCDKESYYHLVAHWMKVALPYATATTAWKFVKSHLFKEQMFVNSRLSSARMAADTDWVDQALFETKWDSITETDRDWVSFMQSVSSSLRVEFLLASYFYDGRYADELASSMTPLVKKDLEKLLYELKEVLLIHFLRPVLQEKLGVVNGPYDIDNFYDMHKDPSPIIQVMFDDNIWGNTGILAPSSKSTINVGTITDEQLALIKEFASISSEIWKEQEWYTIERSEINMLDFVKMFRTKSTLSIEEIQTIINYEIDGQEHASGSFYSIDLRSVNTYFVDWVLQNKDDKDAMKPFAIILN
jgi:hypothetical protein